MAVELELVHKLSTERYDRIVASGALDDAAVELVDGMLVDMSPQGPRHAALVQWLTRRFGARLDLLRVQLPLSVRDGYEPEPDVALAVPPPADRHPTTAFVVVEVAVTAWKANIAKLPGYASAAIPQAWLVDVPAREVHVFSSPSAGSYRRSEVRTGADELDTAVPGIDAFAVDELFAAIS
jgi:Uma2 family endonuclease